MSLIRIRKQMEEMRKNLPGAIVDVKIKHVKHSQDFENVAEKSAKVLEHFYPEATS